MTQILRKKGQGALGQVKQVGELTGGCFLNTFTECGRSPQLASSNSSQQAGSSQVGHPCGTPKHASYMSVGPTREESVLHVVGGHGGLEGS